MSASLPYSTFKLGELVRKKSGSQWRGFIVGHYSTALTPEGYAVESSTEVGSVQIYPAHALERVPVSLSELECYSTNQRDAARYRWLRDQFCSTVPDSGAPSQLMALLENRRDLSLDALVDGAIASRLKN